MPGKTKAAAPKPDPAATYPNLERFLEQSERDSAAKLFEDTRKKLESVGGAKGTQAKKALAAITRVEGLLGELYDVRIKMEEQARQAKMTRR